MKRMDVEELFVTLSTGALTVVIEQLEAYLESEVSDDDDRNRYQEVIQQARKVLADKK